MQETDAITIVSCRVSSEPMVESLSRSISSFTDESFSIYVSDRGM